MTNSFENISQAVSNICFQRVSALELEVQYGHLGHSDSTSNVATTNLVSLTAAYSSWKLGQSEAGMLTARCFPDAPLYIRLFNCGTVNASEEATIKGVPIPPPVLFDDVVMEVVEMRFYNGAMNHYSSSITSGVTDVYETSIYLVNISTTSIGTSRAAGSSFDSMNSSAAPSTTAVNQTFADTSRCSNYTLNRLAPDLILSFGTVGSNLTYTVDNSVFVEILNQVNTATTQLQNSSGLLFNLGTSFFTASGSLLPLLPVAASTDLKDDGMKFYYYTGSLGEPPCTPNVPHLILPTLLTLPTSFLQLVNTSSKGPMWNANYSLTQPLLPQTSIYTGMFFQIPQETNYTTLIVSDTQEAIPEEGISNQTYRTVLDGLIVVNLVLMGVVLIFVLARTEIMDNVVPRGFGGLNHRVMWDPYSYEKAAELKRLEDEAEELEKNGGLVPPKEEDGAIRHEVETNR